MRGEYLDLLVIFKKRMKLIEDYNPDCNFIHDFCVDFFNKIESLSSRKGIYFIEKFNFNSLYKFNTSGEVCLVEKNYFILSEMITLAIDKYGVDAVVKYLLPERIEHAKSSLFYNLLNLFLSLFRKTKINIKNGYGSSAALAEAVNDLRDLKDKKALPSLDRGEAFSRALSTLCLLIFNKYATPIKKANYFEENLKKAAKNKLIIESNLNVGKKWWDDVKSKSTSTPSSVYSDPSNHIDEKIDSYLEVERDDEWPESEWDDGESRCCEHTFVTGEPIYENLPAQALVGINETPLLSSPIEQSVVASLSTSLSPADSIALGAPLLLPPSGLVPPPPPPPPPPGPEQKESPEQKKPIAKKAPSVPANMVDELKQRKVNLQRNQKLELSVKEINESLLNTWKSDIDDQISHLKEKNETMSLEAESEVLGNLLKIIKDIMIGEKDNLNSQLDIILSMEDTCLEASKLRHKISKYQEQRLRFEAKSVSSDAEKRKEEKFLSRSTRKLEKAKTELIKMDKNLKKEVEQIKKYRSIHANLKMKIQVLEEMRIKIKEKDETVVETKKILLQDKIEQLEKKLNFIDTFINSIKQEFVVDSRLQSALKRRVTANQVSSNEESALSATSDSDWDDPKDKPIEKPISWLPQGETVVSPFKKSGLGILSRHSDLRIVDKSSKSPLDTDSGHQSGLENESDKQTSESESKVLADSVYLQSSTFFKLPLPTSVQNNLESFSVAISNSPYSELVD